MFAFLRHSRQQTTQDPLAADTIRAKRLWPHFLLVFLVYTGIFLFIFREIIMSLPSLMQGNSVLSFDEMVPFFDTKTQFWDQIQGKFSDLTNGFEFRVRYSVLTTWMRYYKLVPFTIIASSIGSAYLGFVSLTLFHRKFAPSIPPVKLLYACAASVMLINLILVYSKLTHFYTLILGFDLFFASFLLMMSALFPTTRHPLRLLVAADLLATINPGVHYLVIYSIVHSLATLFITWKNREPVSEQAPGGMVHRLLRRWRMFLVANGLLLVLTLIPYALLTKYFFLYGFEDLHDTVPVNYLLIQNSSIALLKQLSLDITSIMDNYLYGRYSPPYPRIINVFYFFIACIPFIPSVRKRMFTETRQRDILLYLGLTLVLSMWFALGYPSNPYIPTFHRILSLIVAPLYTMHDRLTDVIVKICGTAIEILRFPHRFQFITFAVLAILMPFGITYMQETIAARFEGKALSKKIWPLLVIPFFFFPLFSNWSYRTTLLSGNFNQFISPYPLQNIREIKQVLDQLPEGKTIVLPPSEAQKRTVDENGVRHKFIDKFFIYYLNKPSYHFGLSGDPVNKNNFFFMLWAMLNNDDWWKAILREQNVRYIVVSKEMGPNSLSASEYLKNIEVILQKNVPNSSVSLERKYENAGFVLYEIQSPDSPEKSDTFLSLNWNDFRCFQQQASQKEDSYNLSLTDTPIDAATPAMNVITDDRSKSEMDVYAKLRSDLFFRPDVTIFPFSSAIIPSSFYFNVIYSMFNVFSVGKYNYLNMIIPGTYDTLTSSFVGMPRSTFLKVSLSVPESGRYDVYMRAMPTRNEIHVGMDDGIPTTMLVDNPKTKYVRLRTIYSRVPQTLNVAPLSLEELSKNIPSRIIPVNNTYMYVKVGTYDLTKGKHVVSLDKRDDNPFVIEGVLLKQGQTNPVRNLPINFINLDKTQ